MLDPYNYFFNENTGTYQFTTKNNIVYSVAFIVDDTLNSVSTSSFEIKNVYQVIIDKVSNEVEPLDPRVYSTVDKLISDFFKNVENAMIYICSDSDGKELKRFKTFNRWYNNSLHKEIITKVDNTFKISSDESTYYTALLFHIDNPNVKYILKSFKNIETKLTTDN